VNSSGVYIVLYATNCPFFVILTLLNLVGYCKTFELRPLHQDSLMEALLLGGLNVKDPMIMTSVEKVISRTISSQRT